MKLAKAPCKHNTWQIHVMLFLFICLMNELSASESSPDTTAKGSEQATSQKISVLDRRVAIEQNTRFQPFVLTPHKPNYVLPVSWNETPNQTAFDAETEGEIDQVEVKFQLSIKFPLADQLFGEDGTLYFAYTNLSFWQAYETSSSSPFRETNHEPEIFVVVPNDWEILGFRNKFNGLGISHQSNGRGGSKSRSWNRLYADFIFEHGNFYFGIKPWIRLRGQKVDDNPDIERYMGHGELRAVYATGKHTASLMLRNNFKGENFGATELNYSYPMSRRAKWFVQYFEGYGESLIDYNARSKRIGIGIALTDWL